MGLIAKCSGFAAGFLVRKPAEKLPTTAESEKPALLAAAKKSRWVAVTDGNDKWFHREGDESDVVWEIPEGGVLKKSSTVNPMH